MVTRRHRVGLALEPGIEGVEARPVLADPQDLPVGPGLSVAAARHRVAPSPDVDADACSSGQPPSADHPGVPARPGRRLLMGPITGHRRRIPITVHDRGRGPDTRPTVICRIAARRSPRGGRCHHRPHKGYISAPRDAPGARFDLRSAPTQHFGCARAGAGRRDQAIDPAMDRHRIRPQAFGRNRVGHVGDQRTGTETTATILCRHHDATADAGATISTRCRVVRRDP